METLLLSPVFGHWCDKAAAGCVTSLGYSRGGIPLALPCVRVRVRGCVCPQEGKNATIERPAISPAPLSPALPHRGLHSDVQSEQIL